MRAIARRAGVDPALVHHYFADKAALFAETMALPSRPEGDQGRVEANRVQRGAARGTVSRPVGAGQGNWVAPSVEPAQAMAASPGGSQSCRPIMSRAGRTPWPRR